MEYLNRLQLLEGLLDEAHQACLDDHFSKVESHLQKVSIGCNGKHTFTPGQLEVLHRAGNLITDKWRDFKTEKQECERGTASVGVTKKSLKRWLSDELHREREHFKMLVKEERARLQIEERLAPIKGLRRGVVQFPDRKRERLLFIKASAVVYVEHSSSGADGTERAYIGLGEKNFLEVGVSQIEALKMLGWLPKKQEVDRG